ncbi:MAG: caspase family protein [Cyanobacteria bacterium]|nr:caspase family protein [Cyanobacteriota bacterium]
MKPKRGFMKAIAASAAGVVMLLGSARAETSEAKAEPEKFALMIGINDYKTSPLSGCENDTLEFKKLLVEDYGFKDDGTHIRVLLNRQATKQNIVSAIRQQLIANAKKSPDAIFVFQYSGHGSQVPDRDGDEPDGLDETICPVDTTMDGKGDIMDDELGDLVKELTEHTENVTLILDCCHSGSNLRASEFKSRRLDRPALIAKARKTRGAGEGQDKPILPPSSRYVALVGCMPNELSLETEVVQGKSHGLMTYNLINSLRHSSPSITYRELWSKVSSAVSQYASSQNPQIEGDLDRMFLKGARKRSDAYFNVRHVARTADGKVAVDIDAGTVCGIEQGGLVALYKKSATRLSGNDNLITLGDVTVTDMFSSTVSLRHAPGDDVVLQDAKVVAVTPYFGKKKLRVSIDSTALKDGSLLGKLKEELSKKKSFELKEAHTKNFSGGRSIDPDAGVAIVAGKGSDFVRYGGRLDSEQSTELASKKGFYIASDEGTPLFDLFVLADDPVGEKRILEALEKKSRQQSLLAFTNSASTLSNALDISIERAVEAKKRPGARTQYTFKKEEIDNLTIPTFRVGDVFRVVIQNKSESELYITGVCIGVDGAIQIAFPLEGADETLFPGKTFKTTPITVSGPSGMEVLKLLVTTKPVDFRAFQQPAATVRNYLDTVSGRGGGGIRDMLLVSMYKPESSKLLSIESESLDDWAAIRIDYRIQDAKK